MTASTPPHSSTLLRWVLPLALLWGQLGLSAFVMERRLPEAVANQPSPRLVVLLLLLPALAGLVLTLARRLDRPLERRSPAGDALLLWIMAFFFSAHAILLAVVTGDLEGLHPMSAGLVGGLLLGMAALLPSLPPSSPFGLGTEPSTPPPRWRRVHRAVAGALAVSGILAFASMARPAGLGLLLSLLPAAGAGVWGILALRTSVGASAGSD
ncbi:MAG: hypothetical protein AAFZ18_17055 [Myxococcota bacterium]